MILKNIKVLSDTMSNENEIKCDNINYAVYRIGNWENEYEINILGTSSEIPVTKPTLEHMVKQMDHIRASVFEIGGKEVNGMIGLAMQFNPSFASRDIEYVFFKRMEATHHDFPSSPCSSVVSVSPRKKETISKKRK